LGQLSCLREPRCLWRWQLRIGGGFRRGSPGRSGRQPSTARRQAAPRSGQVRAAARRARR
jgi:hypothetical protein